jgi:hypothetical protein
MLESATSQASQTVGAYGRILNLPCRAVPCRAVPCCAIDMANTIISADFFSFGLYLKLIEVEALYSNSDITHASFTPRFTPLHITRRCK